MAILPPHQPDELPDRLDASLHLSTLVLQIAQTAEAADSLPLTEVACLLAAMHAQLDAVDPELLPKAWDFVVTLRQLHRLRDGRFDSLAGYLASRGHSLSALLARTNLRSTADGGLHCQTLGPLAAADRQ